MKESSETPGVLLQQMTDHARVLAALIESNPGRFKPHARWLEAEAPKESLAHKQNMMHLLPPRMAAELKKSIDEQLLHDSKPASQPECLLVLKKIRDGWEAILHSMDRFRIREGLPLHEAKFRDLRMDECERIALLVALSLVQEFNSDCVGLPWPWKSDDPNAERCQAAEIITPHMVFIAELVCEVHRRLCPIHSLEKPVDGLVSNKVPRSDDGEISSNEAISDLRPGRWFEKATGGILTVDTLRQAVRRKKLRHSQKPPKKRAWHHSLPEVMRVYPQHASMLSKAAADETKQRS